MKIDTLHVIGISKGAIDEEVNRGVDNIAKRYEKATPKPTIIKDTFSFDAIEDIGKSNKKGKKKRTAFQSALDAKIGNPTVPASKVGAYIVFHGGTSEPVNFDGLAQVVLYLTGKYNGALQKVVLSACFFSATLKAEFDTVPFQNFCTKLNLAAPEGMRSQLPMIAAWRNDVYIGKKDGKTGRTETKDKDGKYVPISSEIRTGNKVIAVRSGQEYQFKQYVDAADQWHDGAVEMDNGLVAHVKS